MDLDKLLYLLRQAITREVYERCMTYLLDTGCDYQDAVLIAQEAATARMGVIDRVITNALALMPVDVVVPPSVPIQESGDYLATRIMRTVRNTRSSPN
jgi:hypothetical protein